MSIWVGGDWAAQVMAEFLTVVTSYPNRVTAEERAIERIGEAVEAEVAAIVRDGRVVAAIGLPAGLYDADLVAAAEGAVGSFDVTHLGGCVTATSDLEDGLESTLVVGRFGSEPFNVSELSLLRAMARVLALGLRTLHLVDVERELRRQSETQAGELKERQRLFVRLSRIQRSISYRSSLQEVFDAITAGAAELLAEPDAIVGLRLVDRTDPRYLVMASCVGVPDDQLESIRRTPVGEGAGGRAIQDDRLVIIEDYALSGSGMAAFVGNVSAAMAAPVHEHGAVTGSLVFASRRPDRRFSTTEREILLAFAQHASLALSDARGVQQLRDSFHESLSGIGNKAALEKRELEGQLRQAQKMEAIGRLAGGIAHDFNNVLMVIQTCASLLQESLTDRPEDLEDVGEIAKASERAARLVGQLMTFSRKEVTKAAVEDVNHYVRNLEEMLRRTLGSHIVLELELEAEPCLVRMDPVHVEQIMINLAVNARDAMPQGGRLSVRTSRLTVHDDPTVSAGDYIRLDVTDTGTGMHTEDIEHIFEPFFTTKERGKGTGLGLATVYGIATSAGGKVDVSSELATGTTFSVYIPECAQPGARCSDAPTEALDGSSIGPRTILVTDDEEDLRSVVARLLERNGHVVLSAASGAEALELFREHASEIDVVLSDIVMPEMSGIELIHEIRKLDPGCPTILMSGYADETMMDPSIVQEAAGFIRKPFAEAQLLKAIESCTQATSRDLAGAGR